MQGVSAPLQAAAEEITAMQAKLLSSEQALADSQAQLAAQAKEHEESLRWRFSEEQALRGDLGAARQAHQQR